MLRVGIVTSMFLAVIVYYNAIILLSVNTKQSIQR